MPRKHAVVRSWIQKEKFTFGCLLETRVQERNCQSILNSAFPGWSAITNYEYNRLGRIWFCWSDSVTVTQLHKTTQVITCAVQNPVSGEQMICSAVYASNMVEERKELWAELLQTHTEYDHLQLPWIVLGDFNVTLSSSEHSRARDYLTDQRSMAHFQDMVATCNLADLVHQGALFTWWNKQEEDPIGKKLDRALINNNWLRYFPNSSAFFEAGGISDHARCSVKISTAQSTARKPFRFFNFWVEHELFLPTVAKVWESSPPIYHSRLALHLFHSKLKSLKFELRALNRNQYGKLPARTKEAFEELCDKQNIALQNPNEVTFRESAEALRKWTVLSGAEEKYYRQRACIRMLKAGDQNTSFFHNVVKQRNSKNAIRSLVTETGDILTDQKEIKKEAASHYQRFLQAYQDGDVSATNVDLNTELQDVISYRCSSVVAQELVAPVTPTIIRDALLSLPNDKVSGPDGFTKEFYVSAWSIIGKDFTIAIQSFFMFGLMPTGVNSTILALIPKTVTAQSMKDYRPIACCNLLYKVVSKILANRLKKILPYAIEPNQSAFIKGRLLLENVLLASELVNGYHKSAISTRSTIKLDISKAFDTVKWSFIVSILKTMGLPYQFVYWIKTCISTASFTVSVNGELEGFFTSARGIRQGCSLSPYLYVILNNVLSLLLNKAALAGEFGYHPKCREIGLTHLCFADDILVFNDGTHQSLEGVMNVMTKFADISGLSINATKSSIFVAGEGATALKVCAEQKGIGIGALPIRYLGLPLTTQTLTRTDYEPLIDKVRNQMLSWSNKMLSYAGRLQLIKSVIVSTVNFWSSAYILPLGCLDKIESLCNAFLWSGSPMQNNKAKVSWEDLCVPKGEGGLGIRRLRDSSKVFALSLIWRLFTLSGSLWVAWTRTYLLGDCSFWDVKPVQTGSWIWRKMLKHRQLAYPFIRKEVRGGLDTHFWHDNWLRMGKLIDITGVSGPTSIGISVNAKVSDAIRDGDWCFGSRHRRRHASLIDQITLQPIPNASMGNDTTLWRHSTDKFLDSFSASATWDQLRNRHSTVSWATSTWFSQAVPRYSFITWLAHLNRLSTGDRMRSWGAVQCCVFCGEKDETRDHLYFACPYTFTLWKALADKLLRGCADPDWNETISRLCSSTFQRMDCLLLRLVFQASIYHIWRERNSRRNNGRWIQVDQLIQIIDRNMKNRILSLNYKAPHKFEGLMRRWLFMLEV